MSLVYLVTYLGYMIGLTTLNIITLTKILHFSDCWAAALGETLHNAHPLSPTYPDVV